MILILCVNLRFLVDFHRYADLVSWFPAFSFIEMYLRPPSASEEARINDWIKVRQAGIRYYLSLGDQRIVDKHFIIRPKAEFEVSYYMELPKHFFGVSFFLVL